MNKEDVEELDILLEKIFGEMKEYVDLKFELLEKKIEILGKDFVFHKHN